MRYVQVDNYIIKAPILAVLQQLKLSLTNGKLREIKLNGDNIVVTCPNTMHAGGRENKAACNIYIGNDPKIGYGYARCFVCGFEVSFTKFVAECFDKSESYAKAWLIEHFGEKSTDLLDLGEAITVNLSRASILNSKNICPDPRLAELEKLPNWHPYLQRRKISRAISEEFRLRYDPKTRQIIFPCFDARGRLVMLPTRHIDTKIFYLEKGVEKPLYGIDKIAKSNYDRLMLVEGPFDTLSCWEHGVPAIGTLGSPSDSQIETINKLGIRVIYLGFDNDKWGQKFAAYVRSKLDPRILVVTVQYPTGSKDPNDLTESDWENIIQQYNLPKIKNNNKF